MRYRFLIIFALLLLLTAVDAAAIAQPDPLGSKQAQPSDAGLTNGESDYFAYSPKGRRDPFKPLIQKKEKISNYIRNIIESKTKNKEKIRNLSLDSFFN